MTKQILEGVKVADFSWVGAGPQVGRELAEHGATVVRVESHRRPDLLRTIFPYKDGVSGIDRSASGTAYNTNKLGMSVDLGRPRGREVARRLIEWADVMTESMVPGSMARLGLGYEDVRRFRPDIIYVSTTQQGQYGPYKDFGGYGVFASAFGGFSQVTGWPDRLPLPVGNNHADFISPWYLVIAVAGALLERRKTGKGMYIEQAQAEAALTLLGPGLLDYTANGRVAMRMGNRDRQMCPHGAYPCAGADRWVAIAVASDAQWAALCRALGHPEAAEDPRFATFLERKRNEDALDATIGEWTRGFSTDEVMTALQAAGVPAGEVQTAEDLFADPQLRHREHYRVLEHRVIGPHAYNAPAYRLSKTPAQLTRPGPCLGEHNEYIYKEILGYSEDEIADLLVEGVITVDTDVPDVLLAQQ